MAPDTPEADTCASCGTPLAPDQRYCLACGARRTDVGLAFRDPQPAAGRAAGEPGPVARGHGIAGDRARVNLTILGAVACLLLALCAGVLIGRSGDDAPRAAMPPPQVITVGGAAAPAAATTPVAGTTAGDAAEPAKAKRATAAQRKRAAATAKASKASTKAVQDLEKLPPEQYQKKAAKLPKTVGTAGKAPPVDKSKPAGAGSDVEEIG